MTAHLAMRAALIGALAMTLAGCGPVAGKAVPPAAAQISPTPALPPQRALLAAIPDGKAGAFHFAVTGGDSKMTGVIDPAKLTAEFNVIHGSSLAVTVRVFDRQAWAKFAVDKDLAGPPSRKWLAIAFSKNPPFTYPLQSDPAFIASVVGFATNIRETSPGHYSGLTDLTPTYPGSLLDAHRLEMLGEKARSLPFTAVVNASGRVAALSVRLPAAPGFPATTYQVNYDGYGTTADPAKPAAVEQAPAPAWVYRVFSVTPWPGPAI